MEKKAYETPAVTKVEFDASDRITASASCEWYELYAGPPEYQDPYDARCKNLD